MPRTPTSIALTGLLVMLAIGLASFSFSFGAGLANRIVWSIFTEEYEPYPEMPEPEVIPDVDLHPTCGIEL